MLNCLYNVQIQIFKLIKHLSQPCSFLCWHTTRLQLCYSYSWGTLKKYFYIFYCTFGISVFATLLLMFTTYCIENWQSQNLKVQDSRGFSVFFIWDSAKAKYCFVNCFSSNFLNYLFEKILTYRVSFNSMIHTYCTVLRRRCRFISNFMSLIQIHMNRYCGRVFEYLWSVVIKITLQ